MALYRLPNTKMISVVAQRVSELDLFDGTSAKKGFVVAPFSQDEVNQAFIIRSDIFTTSGRLPALNFAKP